MVRKFKTFVFNLDTMNLLFDSLNIIFHSPPPQSPKKLVST